MHVLVTGHLGYLGPAVVARLLEAGHRVTGLDAGYFVVDQLEAGPAVPCIPRDLRDVRPDDLREFDAVVHLAGLSNDPLGSLDPALTYEINQTGTIRLAEMAREVGVRRFVFSSSCSAYGDAIDPWVDESTPPRPVTAYAESKVGSERELRTLASRGFCVVSLRNATAFGYSPHLRTDLVVNDLTVGAMQRGEIKLNSDGTAWRPLVHVQDIAQAFTLALSAPAERVNGQIVNVGADDQNYTVLEIAKTVEALVPGARLSIASGAGPDRRSYRVRFTRLAELLPDFRPEYPLRAGIRDLIAQLQRIGIQPDRCLVRLVRLEQLRRDGEVDGTLRRVKAEVAR
jgi:nucleoside-diphosphate-sugar epimerase